MGAEREAVQRGQAFQRAERIEAVAGAAERRLAQGAESGVQWVLQGLFHGGELAGFLPALDLEVAIRRECVWLTQSRPFYRPCESTEFQDDPDPQPAFYAL